MQYELQCTEIQVKDLFSRFNTQIPNKNILT